MEAALTAAIAALVGAVIGALASLGGAWVLQREQTRRELAKTAADLAIADHAKKWELLQKSGGGPIAPISVYVAYHADVLRAVAAGAYGPEENRRIDQRQRALIESLHNFQRDG